MPDAADPLPWQLAAARLSYRLAFGPTDTREFRPGELFGPDTPDALGVRDRVPGDWGKTDCPDETDPAVSEQDWIAHFLTLALNEAVHEVLEWFQVDGVRYLNPHGGHEAAIVKHVDRLAEQLALLAETDEQNRH
ncbi:hypothetical protein [Amycolatopsis anabasis]|uniref:hypothetical protein n=1 Tax=Amycolatopsis anabasis TaxID=1840409 RepID=UPI00131D63CB|nr:hypothetical protein [Amycolatopsis anabasis]